MKNHQIRTATAQDAPVIGRLLHDFNTEYDEHSPGPQQLAERFAKLMPNGDPVVLLAGAEADGFAVLRFRPSFYEDAQECYLAELYVRPALRGRGIGKSLMEAILETARARGASYIDLTTSEDDLAARKLYERSGFKRFEGEVGVNIMYTYERDLL